MVVANQACHLLCSSSWMFACLYHWFRLVSSNFTRPIASVSLFYAPRYELKALHKLECCLPSRALPCNSDHLLTFCLKLPTSLTNHFLERFSVLVFISSTLESTNCAWCWIYLLHNTTFLGPLWSKLPCSSLCHCICLRNAHAHI